MKKLLSLKKTAISLLTAVLFTGSSLAGTAHIWDWTEQFNLKHGHTILHTPDVIVFDNAFFVRGGLDLTIGGYELQVVRQCSRADFVKALLQSGLYPA